MNYTSSEALENESEERKVSRTKCNSRDPVSRQQCTVDSSLLVSQEWSLLLLGSLLRDCGCIPLVASDMLFNKAHIISPSKW